MGDSASGSKARKFGTGIVFWDIENAGVPQGMSVKEVVKRIRAKVQELVTSIVSIQCYHEVQAFGKAHAARTALLDHGVKVVDVPHNGVQDAADKAILVDMMMFALDHKPPAAVVLISGDRDFVYACSALQNRGYNVILFTPPSGAPEVLLENCNIVCDLRADVLGMRPLHQRAVNTAVDRKAAPGVVDFEILLWALNHQAICGQSPTPMSALRSSILSRNPLHLSSLPSGGREPLAWLLHEAKSQGLVKITEEGISLTEDGEARLMPVERARMVKTPHRVRNSPGTSPRRRPGKMQQEQPNPSWIALPGNHRVEPPGGSSSGVGKSSEPSSVQEQSREERSLSTSPAKESEMERRFPVEIKSLIGAMQAVENLFYDEEPEDAASAERWLPLEQLEGFMRESINEWCTEDYPTLSKLLRAAEKRGVVKLKVVPPSHMEEETEEFVRLLV